MKKLFLSITTLAMVIFSSLGCMQRAPFEITQGVWSDDKDRVNTSYDDLIISFYTNKTGDELVFLGEKYHYIFNQGSKEFAELLKSKDFLNLKQKNFHVEASLDTKDNRVVELKIISFIPNSDISKEQRAWLATHKFIPRDKRNYVAQEPDPLYVSRPVYNNITVYQKSFFMKGTRYIANAEVNKKAIKLKQSRRLHVIGSIYKDKSSLKKIAMTPLALVGDTALNIIVVGVNVLLSPLLIFLL